MEATASRVIWLTSTTLDTLTKMRCKVIKVCSLGNIELKSVKCYLGGRKIHFYSIPIGDFITKVLPLCSVYQAPSNEPNLTLLAWFLSEFAYLIVL